MYLHVKILVSVEVVRRVDVQQNVPEGSGTRSSKVDIIPRKLVGLPTKVVISRLSRKGVRDPVKTAFLPGNKRVCIQTPSVRRAQPVALACLASP